MVYHQNLPLFCLAVYCRHHLLQRTGLPACPLIAP
jgi:hypothetical protein